MSSLSDRKKKKKLSKISKISVDDIYGHISAASEEAKSVSKEIKKKKKKAKREKEQSDSEIKKLIEESITSMSPIPRDIKVDDRDLKPAPNYLEFCTNKEYLGIKPFAYQIALGLRYFGEYNPLESDMEWFNNFPVDAQPDDFREKLCLLEHGKCPKTGTNRSELMHYGYLNIIKELAGCLGQRCITGDSVLLTDRGLVRIGDIDHNNELGWGTYNYIGPKLIIDGNKAVRANKFIKVRPEKLIKIVTRNGSVIKGTKDHPLFTSTGPVKLKDLKKNDEISIYMGQNIWGTSILDTEQFINDAKISMNNRENSYRNVYRNKIKFNKFKFTKDFARLLGLFIAEGEITTVGNAIRISNCDDSILDFCEQQLTKIYSKKYIKKGNNIVSIHSIRAAQHFIGLVGKGRSADKKIPDCIMMAPRQYVCAFLQALFEGDGCATSKGIEYCTISQQLSNDISAILWNIGIPHRIRERKTWATNGTAKQVEKNSYTIIIEGPAVKDYKKYIGFLSKRKNLSVNKYIKYIDSRKINMPFWYEKYPESIKQKYIDLLNQIDLELRHFGLNLRRVEEETNTPIRRIFANNVALSKTRIINSYKAFSNYKKYIAKKTFNELRDFKKKYCNTTNKIVWTTVANKVNLDKEVTYDFHIPKYHRFIANGLLNHNSGKSVFVGGMMSTYYTHHLMKLQNPSKLFGLLDAQTLHGTFLSLTYKQARENLYDPYYGSIADSPWFQEYFRLLDYIGNKHGEELYKFNDTFFSCRARNFQIGPSGPDRRILRGRTRCLSAPDEIGWMFAATGDSSVKFNAEEIYKALKNSMRNVFSSYVRLIKDGYYGILPPILASISSPSSRQDMIMKLINRGQKRENSNKRQFMVYMHRPTWECNPHITFDDLEEEFEENEDAAWRDYGAVPPMSHAPFISEISSFKPIIDKKRENAFSVRSVEKQSKSGADVISGKLKLHWVDKNVPKLLTLDAGEVSNHYAITLSHNIKVDDKYFQSYDALADIIPKRNVPVNFTFVTKDVLYKIIREFNVKMVAADRWQSTGILSDVEDEFGIEVLKYSLKPDDFTNFKNDLLGCSLIIPKPEMTPPEILVAGDKEYPYSFNKKPISHFIFQCLTVQDMKGKGVKKGEHREDDIFRAAVLAHRILTDKEHRDKFQGFSNMKQQPRGGVVMASKSVPYGSSDPFGSRGNVLPVGLCSQAPINGRYGYNPYYSR